MKIKYPLVFTIILLVFFNSNTSFAQDRKTKRLIHKVEKKLKKWDNYFNKWKPLGEIKVDSIAVLKDKKEIQLYFNKTLSYIPVRENIILEAKSSLKKRFGWWLRKYHTNIYTDGKELSELIPNIYRQNTKIDTSRFLNSKNNKSSIVSHSYPLKPIKGLINRNLAIWHSHGKYYEAKLDRWEWQRARLHSTVEDIFPMTFVLDYIEPMLENAGANVFIPRERDVNPYEIIVDNDLSDGNSFIELFVGTYLKLNYNNNIIKYIPDIPISRKYAVYISYGDYGSENVKYTVHYSGGKKEFIVNQKQGIGTWIYLGKFYFEKGLNPNKIFIEIKSKNTISTDAIRFGGGMGNIARKPSKEIAPNAWSLKGKKLDFQKDKKQNDINPNDFIWKKSGLPRYLEAARYYLQYSGMPDSIVYSLSDGKNDYNDDYKSRGEWVNYLMGTPNGPTDHNTEKGLGIPIEMALAFHTDAGVTKNDSIIGTLAIYNSNVPHTNFPLGQSKMANRDLVDIVQTQIVNDIRLLHNPKWTRRGIWNKPYSEAWRANTPMMLLELMSHQNLADMKFGLDHRFKFDVSRAIYKGILKYLAYQDKKDFTVQPLPVDHFSIQSIGGKKIQLSWSPVLDKIEPTAKPNAYMVYQRKENEGFNQGVLVNDTSTEIELDSFNRIYSYKITALNEGGESFPSEILSVGIIKNKPTVLVVNAFDRISAPAIFDDEDRAGFDYRSDMGVPYKLEIGLTGKPYEFDRTVPWIDDDNPGWGASYSDWEGKVIAGNSFDYPLIHGQAILNAGYSFVSTSDESFSESNFETKPYKMVDLIFGEERTTKSYNRKDFTVFTPKIMSKIKSITDNNGKMFLSGAYIGTDFVENKMKEVEKFAGEVMHYKWRTNFASKSGEIFSTDYAKSYFTGQYKFNTTLNNKIYMVEAPDGIEPVGNNVITAFRYKDTGVSAGIIYNGKYKIVALGFPFETVLDKDNRFNLMKQIIRFFD